MLTTDNEVEGSKYVAGFWFPGQKGLLAAASSNPSEHAASIGHRVIPPASDSEQRLEYRSGRSGAGHVARRPQDPGIREPVEQPDGVDYARRYLFGNHIRLTRLGAPQVRSPRLTGSAGRQV